MRTSNYPKKITLLKTITLKNKPQQKIINEYDRLLKDELYRISLAVKAYLRSDGMITDDSFDGAGSYIRSLVSSAKTDFLSLISNKVYKNLWRKVTDNSIPIVKPSNKTLDFINDWVTKNEAECQSVLAGYEQKLFRIVGKGYADGVSKRDIESELGQSYKGTRAQLRTLARTGVGNLTADLALDRDEQLGVKEFIWRTSEDERVRGNPSGKYKKPKYNHYKLNGKKFPLKGAKMPDGVYLRPGEDWNCRCYSESVITF